MYKSGDYMEKKRKHEEVKFRHRFFHAFSKIIFWPFAKIVYRYEVKSNIKKKGPFLILANHSIALDPLLSGFFNAPFILLLVTRFLTWVLLRNY